MRGKVEERLYYRRVSGITPAYAGKSYGGNYGMWQNRDHPRLCGEKLYFVCCRGLAAGSPPPMRGKVMKHL